MAEIKIEVKNTGNNKVSATNSIVNSISEKVQLMYNEILEKISSVRTWYTDIQSLCTNVENKVDTAIESVENSILEECQEYVDSCKDYAVSENEVETGLYSAKYYSENAKEWAVAEDIIEEAENGEELYSAKYYMQRAQELYEKVENAQEVLDNIDTIIGNIANGTY